MKGEMIYHVIAYTSPINSLVHMW